MLQTHNLSKQFGPVAALRDVSISLAAGEVHGLVGENGAGKSTLIKLLTGFHTPSSGEIRLHGAPAQFDSPRAAQAAGIAAVYQEINLIPERSVAANIFLAREPRRFRLLTDTTRMVDEAAAILARYHLAIDPRAPLRSLGLGLQQMVSIARVVSLGARVVIMDEPTSALASAEVDILYGAVGQLRDEGRAIVYVSHRLSECYHLCDRLTVLRDGRVVQSAATADLPRARLVAAMLGRETTTAAQAPAPAARVANTTAAAALTVRGLHWRSRVRDVSFSVQRGEILGLVGLLGAGRTETFKAIYGAEPPDRGDVAIAGRALPARSPAASIRHGLAFLSEDRRSEGIFAKLSVRANLTAAVLPAISRCGVISRRKQTALVTRAIRDLGIKTASPDAPIASLSGGNQQKVLIARALCTNPSVVMLDDPTRGIDVGAKAEVHRVVRALAADGLGVVVTSSEIEEVLDLASRILVLNEGEIIGELDTAGRDPDDIIALLVAGKPAPEHQAA